MQFVLERLTLPVESCIHCLLATNGVLSARSEIDGTAAASTAGSAAAAAKNKEKERILSRAMFLQHHQFERI
jgi:hypothetical protein